MAQTGYTPILIYSSSTASNAPAAGNLTNSTLGSELAINITDGKLFYKDNANAIQVIGWKTTPTTAGGTGLTSYTAGDLLYYASGTTLSKLAIGGSGYYMSSSGTVPQWSAPAALTKTDDTNVTLTLGGSASTALLNAASLTLGWTGQLAASRGGTGIGSYTAGDLLYASGTTTLSKLAIGAANYVLTSSGSAPQWTAGSSVSVGTASNLLSNATTGVMQITGPGTGTTRVMTIPNANFTVARTDAGQTFSGTQEFAGSGGQNIRIYGGSAAHQWDIYGNGNNLRIGDNTSSTGQVWFDNDVYLNNTNVVQGTAGKGITTGGAFSLGLGTNGSTSQVTIDTSANLNVATGNLLIGTSDKGLSCSVTNGTLNVDTNGTGPIATSYTYRQFMKRGTISSTTFSATLAFASQGTSWSNHVIEFMAVAQVGSASTRYGGLIRYIVASLDSGSGLQGPTALASDLSGLTASTSISGNSLTVTFTAGATLDNYSIYARVLTSYGAGVPTAMS